MAGKIILEAVIYSAVYSAFMLILFRIQGARRQIYNYPPAIRERAIEKGITTQEELDANSKKNKSVGLLMMIVLSVVITCVFNKQYTFLAGFASSLILSAIIGGVVALIGLIV